MTHKLYKMSWSKKEIPTSQFCNVVNRGVDSTDEITSVVSSTDEIKNSKFSHYLCFCVSVKTNQFVYKQIEKYSPEQEKLHNYIKSLHDSGMSYRRITKLLNEKGITTHRGKRWGVTGNSVYSVLKRHKQRDNRLEDIHREYEPEWGRMKVIWERNQD